MTRRLQALLAALLFTGVFIVLDQDTAADQVVEASAPRRRSKPPREPVAAPPAPSQDDAPVPDLFGGGAAAPRLQAPVEENAMPFALIGFKEEEGRRVAFLTHGGAVLLARSGATLAQRYRVLALRQDAVEIRDQQTGKQYRIAFEDTTND